MLNVYGGSEYKYLDLVVFAKHKDAIEEETALEFKVIRDTEKKITGVPCTKVWTAFRCRL
jgi:hypothetical protein